MVSQWGLSGGRSRCYDHWMEFKRCWDNADAPSECRLQKEDYFECLHRKKEIARAKAIKTHYIQKLNQESASHRDAAEKAANGVIVSLGLVEDPSGGDKDKDNDKQEKK